jgi:hypothetical protein
MRFVTASLVSVCLLLGLPLVASGQSAPHRAHARTTTTTGNAPLVLAGDDADSVLPVWQTADGRTLTIVTGSQTADGMVPGSATGLRSIDAHSAAASTGLRFNSPTGLYGRADVEQRNWLSNTACQAAQPGIGNSACLGNAPRADTRGGEIGAGFANGAVKLDLSVGQSRTSDIAGTVNKAANLPRVLPSGAGVSIAAPLLFPDSTATDLSAHGQIRILPDTRLDLGASRGHVHFLPNTGLVGSDDLNQTTLSLGIEHGPVSGAIVGRVLEPALPGAALDSSQRWSGIDLGVSVRLPWQGELSFGAQNVWSSGKQPLLNPQDVSPDQARVPYVQYHQEL